MGAYSNFCSFWQNLTGKILNLAIFRQDKFLKSPKLHIFLVRFCQKVPIIFQDLYGGRLFKMGAYSSAFYRNIKLFQSVAFLKQTYGVLKHSVFKTNTLSVYVQNQINWPVQTGHNQLVKLKKKLTVQTNSFYYQIEK